MAQFSGNDTMKASAPRYERTGCAVVVLVLAEKA